VVNSHSGALALVPMAETVTLDGRSLSIDDVIAVARRNVSVTLDPKMLKAVAESRKVVETAVARSTA